MSQLRPHQTSCYFWKAKLTEDFGDLLHYIYEQFFIEMALEQQMLTNKSHVGEFLA